MDDPEKELGALEHILVDANADPIALSYASLFKVTNGFSQEIGRGGFGSVYMGVLQNGRVAVKKLFDKYDFSERQFEDELFCLIKVKHKNIVRFLGYCSDTSRQVVKHNGTYILADVRRRFLCFEYVPNKSLKEFLKDESYGRDWDTRYKLIAGICHGLRYLHNEERIIHLDLKPENILLDVDMVPKITDFGLSRRFGTEQSRVITKEIKGTRGYIAPEYDNNGEISFKSDMYSLGIIIKKLIRGSNDLSDFEKWHTSLVLDNQQVKRIIEMAQLCISADQHIRPTIDEFINMLNEKETVTTVVSPLCGHSRSNSGSSLEQMEEHDLFSPMVSKEAYGGEEVVHKMEAPNKEVTSDMQGKEELLVPNTGVSKGLQPESISGVVSNETTTCEVVDKLKSWVVLELSPQQTPLDDEHLFPQHGDISAKHQQYNHTCRELRTRLPHAVPVTSDEPQLKSRTRKESDQESASASSQPQALRANREPEYTDTQPGNTIVHMAKCDSPIVSMAVHPAETWIITHHLDQSVCIWDSNTQETVNNTFKVLISKYKADVLAPIFVARKQWYLTGTNTGLVKVYSYETMEDVKTFKAHDDNVRSLDIHPTEPYLLSASYDKRIKLWNWDKGWECVKTFDTQRLIYQVKFVPTGAGYFTGASLSGLQIWNIGSSQCEFELDDDMMMSFDYLTNGDQLQVITGHINDSVHIWEWQSRDDFAETLVGHDGKITTVHGHPDLPIIISGSRDGKICWWNSVTFELEGTLDYGLGLVRYIACLNGSRRIVIGHQDGLAIIVAAPPHKPVRAPGRPQSPTPQRRGSKE